MSTLRENLDRLLALQHLDSTRDRQARLRPKPDALAEVTARVAAVQAEYQAQLAATSKKQGELKDAELELAGLEKKIKDYEAKMRQGTVTNTREVMNFEKEFNQLNRQRSVLDEKILNLMEDVDAQATLLKAVQQRATGLDQDLKTAKTAFHGDLSRVEAEIGRINLQREKVASQIDDANLLKKYETLRARPGKGGVAIARNVENTCGGCHMQVGTVAITKAEIGDDLTFCENCGRIMA